MNEIQKDQKKKFRFKEVVAKLRVLRFLGLFWPMLNFLFLPIFLLSCHLEKTSFVPERNLGLIYPDANDLEAYYTPENAEILASNEKTVDISSRANVDNIQTIDPYPEINLKSDLIFENDFEASAGFVATIQTNKTHFPGNAEKIDSTKSESDKYSFSIWSFATTSKEIKKRFANVRTKS